MMNNLGDYDELVKELRNCVDSLCGECKYQHLQKPGNFVPCMNAMITEAADAIEELSAIREEQKAQIILMAAEDKPRWIPVTERLPEDRRDVQITVFWHDAWRTMYGYYDGVYWYLYAPMHMEVADVYVIGWMEKPTPMPLPQPPEEE